MASYPISSEDQDYPRFVMIPIKREDGQGPTSGCHATMMMMKTEDSDEVDPLSARFSSSSVLDRPQNMPGMKRNCDCLTDLKDIISKSLSEMEASNMQMIQQLIDEVSSLRKEVSNITRINQKQVTVSICELESPFERKSEFMAFENELRNNKEKFEELIQFFLKFGNPDPKKFIRKAFASVMIDPVLEQFAWTGTKDKPKARNLRVTAAIKNAFEIQYKDVPDRLFEYTAQKYFQYARDRQTKRMQSESKKIKLEELN